jgi:hypothetical protein
MPTAAHCCELIAVRVVVMTSSLALPADVAIALCPLSIVRCSLYIVHCPLFIVRCLLFIVHPCCSLYIVRCLLFAIRCSFVRCPLSVVLVTWQRQGWRGYMVAIDVAVSTCEPPCKQRLTAVGQVFMLLFIRSWGSLLAL